MKKFTAEGYATPRLFGLAAHRAEEYPQMRSPRPVYSEILRATPEEAIADLEERCERLGLLLEDETIKVTEYE